MADKKATTEVAAKEEAPKVKLVHMRRKRKAPGEAQDGPETADVHPDEVENYAKGGFVVHDPNSGNAETGAGKEPAKDAK